MAWEGARRGAERGGADEKIILRRESFVRVIVRAPLHREVRYRRIIFGDTRCKDSSIKMGNSFSYKWGSFVF